MKEYDNGLIERLIQENRRKFDDFEGNLENGVIIYGAGFVGTWAAKYFISQNIEVKYFVDQDSEKWGKRLLGIEIIRTDDNRIRQCPFILIAARHAIRAVLEMYGDTDYHLMSFEGYFCVKNYNEYAEVRDDYMEDERSKTTYNALLYAMLTGDTESCLDVMEKDMYFALPEFSGAFDEVFVDAGAFTGDSLERFIWENLGTFRHLYAFEPGERQFKALEKRMSRLYDEWGIEKNNVTLVKAGLSNKCSKMSCIYTDDYPLRHTLSDGEGENNISTYSLDEFLGGKEASFIKVDIEGMEMEFLEGAQKTIMKYKPKMAVCAYHYPSDLYRLAKYVKKLEPSYRFKLRLHAPFLGDYVLYCY